MDNGTTLSLATVAMLAVAGAVTQRQRETLPNLKGSSARGRGGRFVPEWVSEARVHLEPDGFYYDAGMGGFIWRPNGGSIGDPGHQYKIHGGSGYRMRTWGAWYWGPENRSEPIQALHGGSQPWHALDAVKKHWRHINARRRSLRGSRALPKSLDIDGDDIGGPRGANEEDLVLIIEAGNAPNGHSTLRWPNGENSLNQQQEWMTKGIFTGTWDQIDNKLHAFQPMSRRSLRGPRGKRTNVFVLYIDEELHVAIYTLDTFLEAMMDE